MDAIETISYLDENGRLSSKCSHKISDQDLIKGYKTMVLVRIVDERMITLQRQGIITFAMSSLGEEACSVASAAALKLEDWIYPQYRENGTIFWRGLTIEQYCDQMFGNGRDLILGRQMPNHFGSRALNVVQVSSPIGTKIPHAAGCAYAMKIQKEEAIAISYFGEGATSEGDFHVGVNFAAVRKAPVIFFCRNNGYAISTRASSQFSSDGVAPKGVGYGIKTFRIDGNDFFAIHETVSRAREICIKGDGPILIEAMTYRRGAHSTSDDPSRYRSDDEVALWAKKCPIQRLRKYLEDKKLWNEQFEKEFIAQVQEDINKGIAAAKSAPNPPLISIFENVYFEMPQSLKEQYEELKTFFPNE